MAVSKAEGRSTRVKVGPVVVGIGDGDGSVLVAIAIRVSDEGTLPVIIELAVRDGDTGASVGDVEEAIITRIEHSIRKQAAVRTRYRQVFVMVPVAREVDVVNPDPVGFLDTKGITSVG